MAKNRDSFDEFMAHNVNIALPDVGAKWNQLLYYIRDNSPSLSVEFDDSEQLREITQFAKSASGADSLYNLSKLLLDLVEAKGENIKQDSSAYRVILDFVEVAKASYDQRVIGMADKIVTLLITKKKKTMPADAGNTR